MDVVKRFDKTGIYLMIGALIHLIELFGNGTKKHGNTGFTLMCGIICFVISNIIYKAIKIKDDNDLTI